MKKEQPEFKKEEIFRYNTRKKKFFALSLIIGGIMLLGFIAYYALILRHANTPVTNFINSVVRHVVLEIKTASLLGVFYSSAFGGLFLVFLPMEAAFITFLKINNQPILTIIAFMVGIIVSYSVNYFVGLKLANITKRLMSPKKFYDIKSKLNKYGAVIIFVFNLFPLPSQPLSVILGVFNYNRPRFYTLFVSGQLIKYVAMTIGYIYIFN